MDIVIDSSAILAVVVGEPQRKRIIALTASHSLIGPGSIPWEIGNAFSAMLKKNRLEYEQAQRGLEIFHGIPMRYVAVDMKNAISIAHEQRLYAYDAYFLDCAARHSAPLLTLDRTMKRAAEGLGLELLEV